MSDALSGTTGAPFHGTVRPYSYKLHEYATSTIECGLPEYDTSTNTGKRLEDLIGPAVASYLRRSSAPLPPSPTEYPAPRLGPRPPATAPSRTSPQAPHSNCRRPDARVACLLKPWHTKGEAPPVRRERRGLSRRVGRGVRQLPDAQPPSSPAGIVKRF